MMDGPVQEMYPVDDVEWVEGWIGESTFMVAEHIQSFRYSERDSDAFGELDGTFSATCALGSNSVDAMGERVQRGILPPGTFLILDSGATSTVCGEAWLRSWMITMPGKTIPRMGSARCYKFGDSRSFASQGRVMMSGKITVEFRTEQPMSGRYALAWM